MSKYTTMRTERGPLSFENWQRAIEKVPWSVIYEYPLFSDAHVISDDPFPEYGPYQLLMAFPVIRKSQARPLLVLRMQNHLSNQPPQMDKTDEERYHGGSLADEIAALVSVCLGIRLKAGSHNRIFSPEGDARGQPISWGIEPDPILLETTHSTVLPALLESDLRSAKILLSLPNLDPKDAVSLIRAARLYQEAVWIAESAPELSWLMLTSAVETVANRWRTALELPLDRLRTSKPELESLLKEYGDEKLVSQVAEMISPILGATKTFIDFILKFLPPPAARPYEWAQHAWGNAPMKKSLSTVYNYRSRALHGGTPFPAPMCEAPHKFGENNTLAEVPLGLAASMKGGVWVSKDTPMLLHTFEYIVRHSLLNWWKSLVITMGLSSDMDASHSQEKQP